MTVDSGASKSAAIRLQDNARTKVTVTYGDSDLDPITLNFKDLILNFKNWADSGDPRQNPARASQQLEQFPVARPGARQIYSARPSLHWKGLLFIARASRIYRPRPGARPKGHGELLKLLRERLIQVTRYRDKP